MRVFLPLLASVSLIATGACEGPEMAPIGRALEFWDALKNDLSSAKAMVADEAEMGMGDVGGPLDIKVLAEMRRTCEFGTKTSLKPMNMESRKISVVETELDCAKDGARYAVIADFMIENDKIVAFYIPQGSVMEASEKSES